jgi:Xaa-Pro aminopeptidase
MSNNKHLERIRALLEKQGLDAIIVNKQENLHYFSGFTGDDTLLAITRDRALLVTDFRYIEQAGKQAPDFEIVEQKHGLLGKTAGCVKELGCHKVGFEGNALIYDDFARLAAQLGDIDFTTALSLDALRQIKDTDEIARIRQAVAISDKAFTDVLTYLRPGISENDVAAHMEGCMRALGSERPAFTTIVASGIRGSLPHGTATDKLLVAGEFVTMDFGAVYEGYHSDITRTVCIGPADAKQKQVYATVLEAQLLGEKLVKPGASGKAVDKAVRDFLTDAGYGENFGHGLGHSLGLEIHEEPRLSPSSTCEHLRPGTLITVEPGVYLPGWGGLRIEDTVLVTDKGSTPLTASNKQLIEI